jgi:opacity protein-like surface antigen
MRKLLALLVAMFLVVGSVAVAEDVAAPSFTEKYINGKVEVGLDYVYSSKDIDGEIGLGGGVGPISVNATSTIDNFKTNQMLADVGYKLNKNITPYVQFGTTWVEMDQNLVGSLSSPWISGSTSLIDITSAEDSAFTYAFGAKGELLEVEKVKLSYDVRRLAFDASMDGSTTLAPGLFGGIPVDYGTDLSYTQYDVVLMLSREIPIEKYVKSVTPMVGYKYSNVNLEIENTYGGNIAGLGIGVNSKDSVNSHLNSVLLGVDTKVTDNVNVIVGGSFIDDKSIEAKVVYKF